MFTCTYVAGLHFFSPIMDHRSARKSACHSCCVQAKTSESEERFEMVFLFLGLAVAFGLGIYATLGADKAAEYFAGYLLEQSLSIDNLFVFVLIFDYFKTDSAGQDKVCASFHSRGNSCSCAIQP